MVALLALLASCTGHLSGTDGAADGADPPGLTPGGGGSATSAPGETPLDCSKINVSFAPLKRLTREQYDNSMRDLLGVDTRPSNAIAADEKLSAFYSNSVSPVTRLTVEQYSDAAEDVARAVVAEKLETITGCSGANQNTVCADQFIASFGERAFRRPLAVEEAARYHELFVAYEAGGFASAIRLVLQTMLQSPSFVYHLELTPAPSGAAITPLGGYELASRLSFALWNTSPDRDLLAAAAAGTLDSEQGLKAQAERLLASDRSRDALASFHLQWLGLDGLLENTVKDRVLFPNWNTELKTAMRDETVGFADFVIRRGDGKLTTLLSAPFTVASGNPELLKIYGATADPGPDGTIALDPTQRAGLLTQAAFLATHAHSNQTSPVHRGLAVRKNLLCTPLPDPPANVDNTPPEPDPTATTRVRFEQHRVDPSCRGCHELLDPIGVGFEVYDALGSYRTMENNLPIDSAGELVAAGDASGPFNGAVELARRLAESAEVRDCVKKQWFRFSLGRSEGDQDACTLLSLSEQFAASDYDIKALLLALVTSDAFRYRKLEP